MIQADSVKAGHAHQDSFLAWELARPSTVKCPIVSLNVIYIAWCLHQGKHADGIRPCCGKICARRSEWSRISCCYWWLNCAHECWWCSGAYLERDCYCLGTDKRPLCSLCIRCLRIACRRQSRSQGYLRGHGSPSEGSMLAHRHAQCKGWLHPWRTLHCDACIGVEMGQQKDEKESILIASKTLDK